MQNNTDYVWSWISEFKSIVIVNGVPEVEELEVNNGYCKSPHNIPTQSRPWCQSLFFNSEKSSQHGGRQEAERRPEQQVCFPSQRKHFPVWCITYKGNHSRFWILVPCVSLWPWTSHLTSLCCNSEWGWNCLFYWIVSIRVIAYSDQLCLAHNRLSINSIYDYCIFTFCVF